MAASLEDMWNTEFPIDRHENNPLIEQSYYFDLENINEIMDKRPSNSFLSILNINCRSLIKNYNELYVILHSLPQLFDIITVEETWLNKDLEALVQMDEYEFYCKHKKKCKEGGGLGIYVKKDINFCIREDLECDSGYNDFSTIYS